ncbi:MAG TPA: MFS transporter [Acidimicrobiales bacterium]|nr:MFS transporter [Acidimicrobiales bacterium]
MAAASPSPVDQQPVAGTARAALAHRNFRVLFWGSFASSIGTWMQHVTLGAYALQLTGSPTFLGLVLFAQLGPMLMLSVVGGALADVVDRRHLLLAAQTEQMLATAALAILVSRGDPSEAALLAVVALIGVGSALHMPTYSAVLPALVGRGDLAGAVALNSTQMNVARVVGPALGGVAFAAFGAAAVFGLNALTYLFAIAALVAVRIPKVQPEVGAATGWRRLVGGFAVARRDPVVRRCLVTMAAFAFLCLPFIGQMPTLAARNLGIEPSSAAYGMLYTCFGLGAIVGAASIGTLLARHAKEPLVRLGLLGFAVSLAVFALLRSPGPAYPVAAVVGLVYFATVTSLSIVLQERLADSVRGRVMALWTMAFGGVIPLGHLVAGPLVERTSISLVMGYGVVAAVALAVYAKMDQPGGEDSHTDVMAVARAGGEPPAAPVPPPGCP